MTATVSTGRVAGFDAVTIQNHRLRVVVLPSLGGRVWELFPNDAICTKEFVLAADAASVSMHYTIRSEEPVAVQYLFTQHLPLPFVWLFLSYGGWRSVYTAVIGPCSNMPKDLAEAVRLGQSASLGPGGTFRTSATVTLGDLREVQD